MTSDPDMADPDVMDFWRDLEKQPRSANERDDTKGDDRG